MFSDVGRPKHGLDKGIVALVLSVVFFASARTHADPDLWGHVRFGQDILAHGIPTADTYSYLNGDFPWINHELLAEISLAASFNALGVTGLVGFKVVLALVIFSLLYWHLWRSGMNALRGGIVLIAVVMLMSVGLWTIRPQLLTYLLFLFTVLLIEYVERGKKGAVWALPAVLFVWANSHGGFLAGLAVVGIWVVASVSYRFMPEHWQVVPAQRTSVLLVVLSLCIGATLLNPYGPRLIAFLLETATVARPEIGEWQPVSITTPEGALYVIIVALTIGVFLKSRRSHRPSTIAVLLATAVLPLVALRHLPLFGLAFAVFAAEHLADVWNRVASEHPTRRTLLDFVPWTLTAAFVVLAIPHFSCVRINPSFIRFPVRAVELMKRAGVHGNVATFFDWGEYIIWHLSPHVRVSVDGRRETVYSPESYRRSLQFLYGVGEWDAIVNHQSTDMALIGRDQPTYGLMRLKPGWQLVYEDSFASLFVRDGSYLAEKIRTAVPPAISPDGADLCFP